LHPEGLKMAEKQKIDHGSYFQTNANLEMITGEIIEQI
jgi:hypothetical protein